jgi:hypothetical protein
MYMYNINVASSPGHSHIFNVAWEWPGDEASYNAYSSSGKTFVILLICYSIGFVSPLGRSPFQWRCSDGSWW